MEEKMKRIIITLALLTSLMVGCGNDEKVIENENLEKVDNQVNDKNQNDINKDYFIEISTTEFKNKFNSNEKNVFFIGRDTCPACKQFKPTVIEFSNQEKITIYYVNMTDATEDDWNSIFSIVNVDYIPTIVISNNSQVLYNEHGLKSYDTLKSIINEYING